MTALTAAINILPNRYGRLEELNLMPPKPVRQRQIVVEEMNGVLNLLPTLPPGSPGTVGVRQAQAALLRGPHIPHDDVVLPEEVQGIRAFGSETETETVAGVIARHLETMRNKHAITWSTCAWALKGVILDADGSVIYDLFDAFDITQRRWPSSWARRGTNVKKCTTVLADHRGQPQGRVHERRPCACARRSSSPRSPVTPRSRRPSRTGRRAPSSSTTCVAASPTAASPSRSISGPGHRCQRHRAPLHRRWRGPCLPLGTIDTFGTYFAPADFNETVNTVGQPLYAKQEPRKFDRGTDLHTQSNPLPMCHRPGVWSS